MAITALDRHDSHPMQIHLTTPGAMHWAALRCKQCNKHIQWLSQQDTQSLIDMGVGVSTKMHWPNHTKRLITPDELGI